MKNGLVIFDLDGTLVDTSHDLLDSVNFCLKLRNLEPVRYEDLTFLVGQGARVMLRRAFKIHHVPLNEAELDDLVGQFVEFYQNHMPGQSKLYEGLSGAMAHLQTEGFSLAVCTNKLEHLALRLLDSLSISEQFVTVTGGDSFSYRKPDGRHILSTIDKADGDARKAIMIGDSINDIQAAKNAEIPSIAVPFGFSDVPVSDLKPTHIIEHFRDLTPALVEELLRR